MRMKLIRGAALALCGLLLPLSAVAEDVPACLPDEAIDDDALLRRVSLDLRGRIPSAEEYAQVEELGGLPEGLVQSFLQDEGFARTMRRYHEELLWPNVSNVRLNVTSNVLRLTTVVDEVQAYVNATNRKRTWRGGLGTAICDFNTEQLLFDDATNKTPTVVEVNGERVEGFRWVEPYWAPGTQIKVCAYDAQETETVTVGGQQVSCGDTRAYGNRACGCGAGLKFCFSPTSESEIRASLREQVLRSVDDVSRGARPYSDLILGTRAHQDGRIAFWKKHLAQAFSFRLLYTLPDQDEEIRDVAYSAGWAEVNRGGLHAGVVTLPGYLLRFQTDRARANRYSNAFMCRPFEPPKQLVQEGGCSENGTDLSQRCYCQSCHRRLEPLSQHWALFAEAGSTQITDRVALPTSQPSCVGSNNDRCKRFYVTEPDAPEAVRGLLRAFEWSTLHPEYLPAVTTGPKRQAEEILATGEFADCTVRRMFRYFLKRDVDSTGAERELFQTLKRDFISSGYDLPELVTALVSLPQYRRVR